jgi:hypothetical protein
VVVVEEDLDRVQLLVKDQVVQVVVHTEGAVLWALVTLLLQARLKETMVVQRHGIQTQLEVVEQVLLELQANLMVDQAELAQQVQLMLHQLQELVVAEDLEDGVVQELDQLELVDQAVVEEPEDLVVVEHLEQLIPEVVEVAQEILLFQLVFVVVQGDQEL